MNSDKLIEKFNKINTWKSGGRSAPHKPLLLLWAIGRCQNNKSRMTTYSEVEIALRLLLNKFWPRETPHPEDPFWRLQNNHIWEVRPSELIETTSSGSPKVSSLREHDAHGGFPEHIYSKLKSNPFLALEVVYSLLDSHFPETYHADILNSVGIIEHQDEYVKRKPRNRGFSNLVLDAYEHRCAVCEFAIRIDDEPIGLEAAHIKWHSAKGPDIIGNALSLCALHHKLFDRGAFTLSDNQKIIVSNNARGAGWSDVLGKFDSRQIVPPKCRNHIPMLEYIEWHRRLIFRSSFHLAEN
ncbi:MAG: HNH endonuclease [Gammaproteobacteria bacterium]|nr:HNH endonuclease [Gammaproteobacteria bacterium]